MAQRKVYQSIVYQHFSMYALLEDGTKIKVAFTGGTLQPPRNGTYFTSDPEVIKALDKPETGYGKTYKCIAVEHDVEPEAGDQAEDDESLDTPEAPDHSDFMKVSGIKTAQKAKDYLLSNVAGLTGVMLPNLKAIKKIAEENKIVFTDLP